MAPCMISRPGQLGRKPGRMRGRAITRLALSREVSGILRLLGCERAPLIPSQ